LENKGTSKILMTNILMSWAKFKTHSVSILLKSWMNLWNCPWNHLTNQIKLKALIKFFSHQKELIWINFISRQSTLKDGLHLITKNKLVMIIKEKESLLTQTKNYIFSTYMGPEMNGASLELKVDSL